MPGVAHGPYRCFLIEQTGERRVTASSVPWGLCTKNPWQEVGPQHRGERVLFEGPEAEAEVIFNDHKRSWEPFEAICLYCGESGGVLAVNSTGMQSVWIRRDTGERHHRTSEFGTGAMYFAEWEHYARTDTQGRQRYGFDWDNQYEPSLCVNTPDGSWNIDGRASNCTMKDDKLHRCWVRHGTPPDIHVDKHGHTCAAGAGSIQKGKYHGFLHRGRLT